MASLQYLLGNQYQSRTTPGRGMASSVGSSSTHQRMMNSLQNAYNKMASGGSGGRSSAQEHLDRGLALTEGRAQDILDDPRYTAALDAFNSVVDGSNLPMGDEVQNAMFGQQADMNAAAQRAQDEAMARGNAASGGSIYDPSYQSAQRGNLAQRQLANQGAQRDIAMQAALANFDAQQQAAGNLASVRGQQYGLGNPLASQAANIHGTLYADRPQTQVYSPSQFAGFQYNDGGGNTYQGVAGSAPAYTPHGPGPGYTGNRYTGGQEGYSAGVSFDPSKVGGAVQRGGSAQPGPTSGAGVNYGDPLAPSSPGSFIGQRPSPY